MTEETRSIGAFRWSELKLRSSRMETFDTCDSCGGIFHLVYSGRPLGFGSRSSTHETRERERQAMAELQSKRQRFENLSSRCRCDPEGDIVHARKYAQEEADRRERIRARSTTQEAISRPARRTRPKTGTADDLAQLAELFERGVLTREQFEAAKNKVLGISATTSPAHPAAWYPDPSGRYPLRYWDGTKWTAHVSSANGVAQTIDPRGAL